MRPDDTDDALSWGDGADDPSHVDGTRGSAIDAPATRVDGDGGAAASTAAQANGTVTAPHAAVGASVLLVAYGILGGVYLLYSIGWIIAVQRDGFSAGNILFDVMYQLGQFLAIAAPIGWATATLLFTRDRAPLARVLWLLAGIVLLAPWPFILGGGA
ncbi:hypothetical protein [Marisediminicola senii]|uniref:hypothetical protein n=1 Tax=Marisediminicola senii TaxID=2711233 RepID=UPI0013ECFA43|nr:hypothetical protein [Marisediminicola senii]